MRVSKLSAKTRLNNNASEINKGKKVGFFMFLFRSKTVSRLACLALYTYIHEVMTAKKKLAMMFRSNEYAVFWSPIILELVMRKIVRVVCVAI